MRGRIRMRVRSILKKWLEEEDAPTPILNLIVDMFPRRRFLREFRNTIKERRKPSSIAKRAVSNMMDTVKKSTEKTTTQIVRDISKRMGGRI